MEFCGIAGGSGGDPHHQHHGSDGGSAGAGGSGSPSSEDPLRRKKRYHRHTTNQIQRLEAMFKECPHPDEKQRQMLSRELGLAPRQIKFWFQNRRTQMKAQHERADNCALRAENDRIRCENITIREALRSAICPSCGTPPTAEDSYFEEQKLRMENAQLKEELDRVSSIAAKYIGRPISQLLPVPPMHISSLDLSMSSFGAHGMAGGGPSLDLDLDLHPGTSSSAGPGFPFQYQPVVFSDMDKSLMAEAAATAMEELLRLVQTNEPLWVKSPSDGRDMLDIESYNQMFPRADAQLKNPNIRAEASRDSRAVMMNALALVDMFMNPDKWMELFPTIVSIAKPIELISSPIINSHNGSLQLMYEELQVLSPVLPAREFFILRYCQQIEQGLWAIVDVSYDISRHHQFDSQSRSRRLPSGCLIQDLPNGYSKVTWVEHVMVEERSPTHRFFRELIYSGLAFGADRWLATLERMCERMASLLGIGSAPRDPGGIPSPEGKRSMMKLAQRMVSNFCSSIGASSSRQQRWTVLSRADEMGIRIALHRSTDPGMPNGIVLSAATTIWLPISPQSIFSFFKDERTRPQWDVLSNGNAVHEVAHIANGSHPGNCVSVLRAYNTSQNNMLILQESCIDSSGSLVVYCPVDLPAINLAMSGEDTTYIPLLPSGFTISPDGRTGPPGEGTSSSSSMGSASAGGGSLVTVAFQILVSNLPTSRLSLESVDTVNHLISTTVQQIKAALNCPAS